MELGLCAYISWKLSTEWWFALEEHVDEESRSRNIW